ncbi:MAG: BolA/IbaG family iron-sulfur metabolism protein [Alphaproteobacteria bacterium]|nr:BolA/IbaG family iron-sulfur metabolism protein [Alphaproteobacteria bacterium]
MPLEKNEIIGLLEAGLPECIITIEDLAGDNDHWAVKIVSSAFQGKSRVQQHQLVYAALQGKMGNELHALSIKTESPQN